MLLLCSESETTDYSSEHLPEDHQFQAQYLPRDPVDKRPPIGRDEFRQYLRPCGSYCIWSTLPLFRHRCSCPHEATHKRKRIPRKTSRLDTKAVPQDPAYAIQAAYELSLPMVLIYYIISVLAWFGFLAWWLGLYPNDLSNGSVPLTIFLNVIPSFMALLGCQKRV